MKKHIYADNAATSKLDDSAFEKMIPWLTEEFGNASQPYSFSKKPKKALADARACIAECIGADPEEIFFTSGGTESNNWAIKNFCKKNIITSSFEHHAILNSCLAMEQMGSQITYIQPNELGYITTDNLKNAISNNTALVSIMSVNNEIGTIQNIKELCKIAHSYNAFFHTDAVQAIGHIKIDVHELGIDMLSASGHKFNGPKGVGFMYVKNGCPIVSYINGGSQEKQYRAGTENIASIIGMAEALKNNHQQLTENIAKLKNIENIFISTLRKNNVQFLRLGGNNILPGFLNLSLKDFDGEAILHRLDLKGISISTGSACDSKNTQISHVLKSIGLDEKYAKGTIRITFGKYNTEEDAVIIANELTKIYNTANYP